MLIGKNHLSKSKPKDFEWQWLGPMIDCKTAASNSVFILWIAYATPNGLNVAPWLNLSLHTIPAKR